jgi:hypothetical protein
VVVSFQVTDDEPTPLRRAMRAVDDGSREVVKRWRAIILIFVLLVAIWLAVQAVLAVYRGYVFLRDNAPRWRELAHEVPLPARPAVPLPPLSHCWRDRSLPPGSCFKEGEPEHHHTPVPHLHAPDCGCMDI